MPGTTCEAVDDDALVAQAAAGEVEAFDELYRRHHVLARRLAHRITGNEDDAREAAAEAFTRVFGVVQARGLREGASFRSYLLTTVRHLGIDKVRHHSRMASSDDAGLFDRMSSERGPADTALSSEDGRLLLEAFRQLPQRSQSVLWLVDVERVPTRVAAEALGLTPGNVAQIAVRARTRLRHGYVQAHLTGAVDRDCRFTVEHLGAFLDGGLCKASVTKLQGHLDGCESCRGRVEELRDLGVTARRAFLPALLLQRLTGVLRRERTRPRPEAIVPSADIAVTVPAQTLPLGTHVVSVVSHPAAVDVLQTLAQSPVVQRVMACVAAGTMAVGASSVALKSTPTGPAAAGAVVSAAGPTAPAPVGSRLEPGPAEPPPPRGGQPGSAAPIVVASAGLLPSAGRVAASGGPAGALAPAAVVPPPTAAGVPATPPSTLPAGTSVQSQASPVQTITVPTVPVPPQDADPAAPPPASQVASAPVTSIPSPSIPAPPVTVQHVSAPAPAPAPVPAPGSLPDSIPLSTVPPSVPPVSVPVSVPVSAPPLSVLPESVPLSVPLSTPPLTVPPASVPLSVPLSTPPLTVPSASVPLSVPLSTPPLTVPSVSVPVSVPPAQVPLPVPLETPALSVPVSTPALAVPPASVPVSVPPLSPPVAGPPLPLPAPLSTVTSGILP